MSLTTYKKKRSFNDTPEPTGGRGQQGALRFVVQKHAASHLHYDFRLEMDGVLKSWAVPKGPSLNPEVKRLAMMVEDHPYDYKDFEGIIPEGNYGAGTVIVWDEGTYEALEEPGSKLQGEKLLLKQLKAGSIKVRLKGKKLKGEFALVRTKGMGDNAWLLIKHNDRYAKETDITAKDKSVLSGKTLEKMAETAEKEWVGKAQKKKAAVKKKTAPKKATVKKKAAAKKTPVKKTTSKKTAQILKGAEVKEFSESKLSAQLDKGIKSKFPVTLSPMLATLAEGVFDDEDWEFEVKWDGYRALAFLNKKSIELKSRNDKSFEDQFYPVYEALKQWPVQAVVDGEIVAVNDKGIADFAALQNWRSEADGTLLYYVFDLLWLNGKSLINLPLYERKALLQSLVPEEGVIRAGFTMKGKGNEFFKAITKMGLEGMVAKRSESLYYPGERSRDWLKIKVQKRQEIIIAGYTLNKGSSKLFSALLLGRYNDNGKLEYAGKVGTGFNDKMQQQMMQQFKKLTRKTSPFAELPDYNKPSRFRPNPPDAAVIWLRPQLVGEINYSEITRDGVFRHPSFIAMREDKAAKSVKEERPVPIAVAVDEAGQKEARKIVKPPAKAKGRTTLLNPKDESQARKIDGHELHFSNLSKIYWPDDKISKREMLNYYYQVAPYILPYLKDRPLSLNRFPNGIKGKSFYQKDVKDKVPDWTEKLPYRAEGDTTDKEFLVGSGEATLLYIANMGTIEMNPWSSRTAKPDNPDWCVLDLDPDKGNTFDEVITTALEVKKVLDQLKIPGYCKTSGSTGLHIYIPLGAKYSYDQSQLLGKFIATQVQLALPELTSIERMTRNRKGQIYIDYLQNRPQATLAAPYSLRPKPGATVSMPLHWEEVKKGLKMKDFTIKNALARLESEGDIFKPVLGKGINLKQLKL
jgi:bifunctional non-homologous end joining protein LigD